MSSGPGGLALGAPLALLAGLAAAGLILLLHTVRPRPRAVTVSSVIVFRWLRKDLDTRSLLRRLLSSLEVLLQVLAALLLGLALARPAMDRGGTPPTVGVLVVDGSLSMSAVQADGRSRYQLALDALAAEVQKPSGGFAGLQGYYAAVVGPAGARVSGPFSDPPGALRAIRQEPGPSSGKADFRLAVPQILALAPGSGRPHVVLVTDGVMGPEQASALEDLAGRAELRLVPVGQEAAPNLAVTAMQSQRSGPDPRDLEVAVEVASFSPEPASVELEVRGDSGFVRRYPLTLAAGERASVVVPYRVEGPGALRARLALARPGPDAVAGDDERALAFPDPGSPALVHVVGEESTALRHALSSAGNVAVAWAASPRAPMPTGPLEQRPPGPDLAIFNGVRAPEIEATPWRAPVVWVLPPADTREHGLDEAVTFWDRSHPLLRFVDLDGVRVHRSPAASTPGADADVIVTGSGGPLLWESVGVSGETRIESAFALSDSNLAPRVAFAVLVSNLLRKAAPHALDVRGTSLEPGSVVTLRVPEGESKLLVVAPDDRVQEIGAGGSRIVSYDGTERAGVYLAWGASGESGTPVAVWAVAPATGSESDLRHPHWPSPEARERPPAAAAPKPLWPYAVALAVLVMAGEAAAYLLSRRLPAEAAAVLRGRLLRQEPDPPRWLLRRRLFLALRAAGLAAIALALLAPAMPWPRLGRYAIFLVDVSDSITAQARDEVSRFVEAALRHMGRRDRAWVIEFAGELRLTGQYEGGRRVSPLPFATGPMDTSATDLASGLDAARSLVRPGWAPGQARIVLVSDGRETRGDVLAAARRAAPPEGRREGDAGGAGAPEIPVDVLPVMGEAALESAVGDIQVPEHALPGQAVTLRLQLFSSSARPAEVRITRNGQEVWEQPVSLSAGWGVYEYVDRAVPAAPGQVLVYRAELSTQADTYPDNNVGVATVHVTGLPAVLVVSAGAPEESGWLAGRGFQVNVVRPERVPASRAQLAAYSSIVLENVPAAALTNDQMRSIASFTSDLGGGLVILGGHDSFGPGGYRKTPIEEVSPVWADVPRRLVIPQVALVLALDKSGSMGERQGTRTKLDAARLAALAATELLGPDDLVGVLAFDAEPRWIVPVTSAADRTTIAGQIARLTADGGTEMGPALREALSALRQARAMVRHVIVLTDGKSTRDDFEGITHAMAQAGVTVSTVAIGPDADTSLLADIARWGSGRFYATQDPRRVPQIFATETLTLTRTAVVNAPVVPVRIPVQGPARSLLPGVSGSLPALGGYVATTPKPAAEVLLSSPEGDPVLAAWRSGLGRVVAFTSSLSREWGRDWRATGLAAAVLDQMVRWVTPAGSRGAPQVVAELHGATGTLVVEYLERDGRPVNFLQGNARISGPGGHVQDVEMRQEAPGRYVATFDAAEPGEYVAAIELGGSHLMATVARAYPEEYRPRPAAPSLLVRVAMNTGGRLLDFVRPAGAGRPGQPSDDEVETAAASVFGRGGPLGAIGGWERRDAWPLLVALGMALLVSDVAVRRVVGFDARSVLHALRRLIRPSLMARRLVGLLGGPDEEEIRRLRDARSDARGAALLARGSADARTGATDPGKAARLYLARLQRERARRR